MIVETVDPVVGMVEVEGGDGMGAFLTASANQTSCFLHSSLPHRTGLNSLGDTLQSSDGMVNSGSSAICSALQERSSSRRWGATLERSSSCGSSAVS